MEHRAMSTIPYRAPQRPSSRKRKPAPATVLQLYRHEVSTSGLRGAANRTATALGISDDTVRRIVARDEEARKAREETPPDLEYVPFDPDYEAERIAANAAVAPVLTELLAAEMAAKQENDVRRVMSIPELEMRQSADETPQDDTAERRSPEPENDTLDIPQTPQPLPRNDPDDVPEPLPGYEGPTVLPDVGPRSSPLDLEPPTGPISMAQPGVRERVVTRIVRLPAETHQRGIYDRLAGIDATSIMGPELGAAVAFLLIVLTFWGLG